MNDKYEQLKSVIQAVNPEIMELKFGCEVARFADEGIVDIFCSMKSSNEGIGNYDITFLRKGSITINTFAADRKEIESWKILGRPIRLSDVLWTIQGHRKPTDYFAITQSGVFIENELKTVTPTPLNGRLLSTGAGWNLKDDNLDHQSEE